MGQRSNLLPIKQQPARPACQLTALPASLQRRCRPTLLIRIPRLSVDAYLSIQAATALRNRALRTGHRLPLTDPSPWPRDGLGGQASCPEVRKTLPITRLMCGNDKLECNPICLQPFTFICRATVFSLTAICLQTTILREPNRRAPQSKRNDTKKWQKVRNDRKNKRTEGTEKTERVKKENRGNGEGGMVK